MKEFKFEVTHQGKRKVFRHFGYNMGSATQSLKAEIGYFSIVKIVELA